MIKNGDRIAVGVSGGKDSVTLLTLLAGMKRFYPANYTLTAIFIDMGLLYSENEIEALQAYCDTLGVKFIREKTDIGKILFDIRKEQNPCSLCSKLRRGALNTVASANGLNKLALGHHADDLVETFFLSLFYEGRLSTFEPVTYLDRSKMTVIRPMLFIEEKDIAAYAKSLPTVFNPCPADKHTQREEIKNFVSDIKKKIPFAKDRILSAIFNPERNHLFDDALKKLAEYGYFDE